MYQRLDLQLRVCVRCERHGYVQARRHVASVGPWCERRVRGVGLLHILLGHLDDPSYHWSTNLVARLDRRDLRRYKF